MNKQKQPVTRLFSHLEFDGNKLQHQPGSVLGNIALIAGTSVGAGILGLPAVTLPSGIIPSTILLLTVWAYTVISGLLIAEVTLNVMRVEGIPHLGLLAIIEKTVGKLGARIAGVAYLFMHYALLVAYMTEGGEVLATTFNQVWQLENILPHWVGTVSFALVFGSMMYLGRDKLIEKLNEIFIIILLTVFVGLLVLGGMQVQSSQFLVQNWHAIGRSVAVMYVAMFFQSIVPLVVTQLEGDVPKIRQSIIIGSLIPLFMFLAWNAVILGCITPDILQHNGGNESVFDPLQILRNGRSGGWFAMLLSIFSEFAIITSFIGVTYGLRDFFKDVSSMTKSEISRLPLYSLVLLPPLGLGTFNPTIFFHALEYTGTFSISILGGIMPALMRWRQTQIPEFTNSKNQVLVPGGKITLILMIFGALLLIGRQVFQFI
ncbi:MULTISPECIES: amino acid permease [unclassified Anabaena]|uniref:amino acid permease n=1 Tax=unclassified Anabaena TaxID=2619674 RepID=UPI001447A6DD|nr:MULTISPECIES: aromatic amino acid transport family protein [unclassified Anabaena]MTJ09679.1 tyrosine transporter [Anabaena sp. UHCC 0204]MTJ54036.1 tyrosine transporter [Anabaena sp. UHCC 0253]